jgi:S1-C subfamily serine protease
MVGAVGPANLWGLEGEPSWQVLRIPVIGCGAVDLTNGVAVPFDKDTLDFFQRRAGVSTIGLIGADVLLNYRIGIDYAHSSLYLKQLSKYTPPGIDVIGLTLKPEADGRYTIIGVAQHGGKSSAPEVKVGDTLMTVDNARAKGGTMGQVWSLLSGSPGDVRTLGLMREGKPITVKARVYRFLPTVPVASKRQNH